MVFSRAVNFIEIRRKLYKGYIKRTRGIDNICLAVYFWKTL